METNPLHELLREWRALTEGERQAIVAQDWPLMQSLQQQKSELQLRISTALDAWQNSREGEGEQLGWLKHLVSELVSLETSNAELVAQQREKVRVELAGFERSSGNLRGLNRAYGTRPNACWTSYS